MSRQKRLSRASGLPRIPGSMRQIVLSYAKSKSITPGRRHPVQTRARSRSRLPPRSGGNALHHSIASSSESDLDHRQTRHQLFQFDERSIGHGEFPVGKAQPLPFGWSAPVATSIPACIASPINLPISGHHFRRGGIDFRIRIIVGVVNYKLHVLFSFFT